MINATEIIGVNYPETFKRQGSFGYYVEEVQSKSKDFIVEAIKDQKDYKYFDRWGNK